MFHQKRSFPDLGFYPKRSSRGNSSVGLERIHVKRLWVVINLTSLNKDTQEYIHKITQVERISWKIPSLTLGYRKPEECYMSTRDSESTFQSFISVIRTLTKKSWYLSWGRRVRQKIKHREEGLKEILFQRSRSDS